MPDALTPERFQALENLPLDESTSRLEPYREIILRWRRQRRSYRKIQQILRDELNVNVTFQALFKCVKLRSKPRKPAVPEIHIEQAHNQVGTSGKRLTTEERAAAVEHVRSLNRKPVVKEQQPLSGWDLLEPDNVSFRPKGDQ